MGRGRSVIGGTLHATLTPADVRQVIFDGFFPTVGRASACRHAGHAPACTRWACPTSATRPSRATWPSSLARHTPAADHNDAVNALLFNGGVFQPASSARHLLEVMHGWYDTARTDRGSRW